MKLIKYIEGKLEIMAVLQRTHNSTFTIMIQSHCLASPHICYFSSWLLCAICQ